MPIASHIDPKAIRSSSVLFWFSVVFKNLCLLSNFGIVGFYSKLQNLFLSFDHFLDIGILPRLRRRRKLVPTFLASQVSQVELIAAFLRSRHCITFPRQFFFTGGLGFFGGRSKLKVLNTA